MTAPILYEVNTRAWLHDLSLREGRTLQLSDLPDFEIERWSRLGFTHIWLMGVWQIGPAVRQCALEHWRAEWQRELPGSTEADVQGSPFAIQEYSVDQRLGGPLDLLLLKERFSRAGLKLILDFIPNHFGLDSPEPPRFPARFVQADRPMPGTFECDTRFGKRWLAHGRDPYFPPWLDTVQLDYRVRETHEHMAALAQTASMYGHGLRCDMAMLLLPEIFAETWRDFPSAGAHPARGGFWKEALPRMRQLQPEVDLIAEAYWGREQELQDLGFDFTYNKTVYDFILRGQDLELARYLAGTPLNYLRQSVHFLENHDEPRVASRLSPDRHKAAAALILFLPGMALLHDGQLEGRKSFARIQVASRAPEQPDAEIARFYDELLGAIRNSAIRRGKPSIIIPAGKPVIAVQWEARDGSADLGIVNLGTAPADFDLPRAGEIFYGTNRRSTPAVAGRIQLAAESAVIVRLTPDQPTSAGSAPSVP